MKRKQRNSCENANAYIEKACLSVQTDYKGIYHFSAPTGWLNDPNGVVYFKGQYHLFYQYHPYSAVWGPMHWGHAVSDDLVKWTHLPVALAPDCRYDRNGCWSGSAIVHEGKLVLVYTGIGAFGAKTQNLAYSKDGVHFQKYEKNPIIKASRCIDKNELRDPFVWKNKNTYYCLLAANGCAKLYTSADLLSWNYRGKVADGTGKNVLECPCMASVGEQDIFIASPVRYPKKDDAFQNYSSNIWVSGKMDYENNVFKGNECAEIDCGTDFYAARCGNLQDGTPLLLAWMQMWERKNIPHKLSHGWCGSLTLPRELKIQDETVLQKPISALEKYYTNCIKIDESFCGNRRFNGICGRSLMLKIDCEMRESSRFGIRVFDDDTNYLEIIYDRQIEKWIFDITHTLYPTVQHESESGIRKAPFPLSDNRISLEIFLDRSSVEVFIADGALTSSMLCYNAATAENITFFADKPVRLRIEKNDIEMN